MIHCTKGKLSPDWSYFWSLRVSSCLVGQNRKECHCISSYSKTSGPQHYSAYLLQGRNTARGLGAGRREEVMGLVEGYVKEVCLASGKGAESRQIEIWGRLQAKVGRRCWNLRQRKLRHNISEMNWPSSTSAINNEHKKSTSLHLLGT